MNDTYYLVYVYLGPMIPKYLTRNLRDTKRRFGNQNIIFIGDHTDTVSKIQDLGIQTFLTKDWALFYPELWSSMGHPQQFRDGFWFKTVSRFFALSELQTILDRPILHLEGDVWIANNFPFQKFLNIPNLAFGMETDNQGSACLLWLPTSNTSKELSEITYSLLLEDSSLTDMRILGHVQKSNLMEYQVLPTLPRMDNVDEKSVKNKCSELYNYFGGCFDALPYGMFLLGDDPRNSRARSVLFRYRKEQIMPRPIRSFYFDESKEALNVEISNKTFRLFNLHVHSKDPKIWGTTSFSHIQKYLDLHRRAKGEITRFIPTTFIYLCFAFIRKKMNWVKKAESR